MFSPQRALSQSTSASLNTSLTSICSIHYVNSIVVCNFHNLFLTSRSLSIYTSPIHCENLLTLSSSPKHRQFLPPPFVTQTALYYLIMCRFRNLLLVYPKFEHFFLFTRYSNSCSSIHNGHRSQPSSKYPNTFSTYPFKNYSIYWFS